MPCAGNAETHCCWLNGEVCKYLEENTVPDRRWACGLMRRLKDWDKVLNSKQYKRDVAPVFEPLNISCKNWPDRGEDGRPLKCADCGYGF